ncbi:MAG: hypothetical protein CENE_02413 [Candidatus Celerinatantimonas neptuna]|nr:MAG: hypothetical protein CENE_02413 [Candidatus Celerinatantimonas neptuna]
MNWFIKGLLLIQISLFAINANAADIDQPFPFKSNTQTQHWYIEPGFSASLAPLPLASVTSGYEGLLPAKIHWFVEAGVEQLGQQQISDIASRNGINLSTGIRYYPLYGLKLSGQILQQHQINDNDASFELNSVAMQLKGAYRFTQQINLQASYAVGQNLHDKTNDQQINIGVQYHF